MQLDCAECNERLYLPHSCGHRNCPHCQNHESQQWLERQLAKRVPAGYFLITFTLPAELRGLAWLNQRLVYSTLIKSAWETLEMFSRNDKKLKGRPGAIAVLHTHARNLDYHPHVHVVMPAAAIELDQRLWRTKTTSKKKRPYLFNHKALAKVFRGKVLTALTTAGLNLPQRVPYKWVVDCKSVGNGEKALVYLGRYLYRGVILEKNIVACRNGMITFKYKHGKTGKICYRTVPGATFLWMLLKHVLPQRFRRARNFGFLHANSKRLIHLIQHLFRLPVSDRPLQRERPGITCPCCGAGMLIVRRGMHPSDYKIQNPLILT